MPVRICREKPLQRLDIAFRERLIAAPHNRDVLSLSRTTAAHVRLLPPIIPMFVRGCCFFRQAGRGAVRAVRTTKVLCASTFDPPHFGR